MTNADVPTIACKDIIEHPINPYTGNEINNKNKYECDQITTITSYTYMLPGDYTQYNYEGIGEIQKFSVHDNIFKKENWNIISDMK